MNKTFKYASLFTGGAAVGFGICGYKLIGLALKNDHIRNGIEEAITDKVKYVLYENSSCETNSKNYSSHNHINWIPKDVLLGSGEEAAKVLSCLQDLINKYGIVTVADFHDMVGLSSNYMDNKFGWTVLNDVDVIEDEKGWYLNLPNPRPID